MRESVRNASTKIVWQIPVECPRIVEQLQEAT